MSHVQLLPAGVRIEAAPGTPLQDVLAVHGVEFPCGGHGRCKGCRVRMTGGGRLPVTEDEARLLTPEQIGQGWRMACRQVVRGDVELEVAQWEMPILGDESPFVFTPGEGLGVAVDVGTTTVVAQLLDLQSGNVLAVGAALNDQARHGADIMSRIEYAMHGGEMRLRELIRAQIGGMIGRLLAEAGRPEGAVKRIVLAGNTVMHHLFAGLEVASLGGFPFAPQDPGRQTISGVELGWPGDAEFLPCIGGFVGSDILAGIVAAGLHRAGERSVLVDLGTNGEIVIGNRERLLCASTAAGPAFEGARIAMGMRAAAGAISEVRVEGGGVVCRTIGGAAPRGICGSGLVDAVAVGLELGCIRPDGRMDEALALAGGIAVEPADVRELQLAKAAIAAGLRILTARLGVGLDEIERVHLAGAFGNSINRVSARRIGLLDIPVERIIPAGNTALRGVKRALFAEPGAWDELARHIEHVALHADPRFQDIYAAEMGFPG